MTPVQPPFSCSHGVVVVSTPGGAFCSTCRIPLKPVDAPNKDLIDAIIGFTYDPNSDHWYPLDVKKRRERLEKHFVVTEYVPK